MPEAARNNPDIPSVGVVVKAGRITETLNEELIQPFDPDLVICGERGLRSSMCSLAAFPRTSFVICAATSFVVKQD